MAQTLLYMPMSIVGYAISQLYYKDASEAYNQGKSISLLTRRLFMALFCGGTIFMILLIVSESWLFGFVLGSKWTEVGRYAVLLSPWLLMVTSLSPLSQVFAVKKMLNVNMVLNLIGMLLRVVSIPLVAYLSLQSDLTVLSFGLASTLFYFLQGYYILKLGEVFFYRRDYFIISVLTIIYLSLFIWKVMSYFIGV